jgi:DNA-binding ferritin-like protein
VATTKHDHSSEALLRSLGFPAPGTYRQLSALTSIKEEDGVQRPRR